MHIGANVAAFTPHHHRQLGVGLQFHEAINHLHAGAFERRGPDKVLLLVETRLQFDDRRHRLAGFGGIDQRADDRGVLAGAIQRLLDGDDIGVGRRLLEERQHHLEAFIGVVDDKVLGADGGKTIAAMFADSLGKARRIGLELQIGPVFIDEQRQIGNARARR